MDRVFLKFLSFFISLVIYLGIITIIFYGFFNEKRVNVQIKDSAIDVVLEDRKPENQKIKKVENKKINKNSSKSAKMIKSANINELFSTIKSNKGIEQKSSDIVKSITPSRLKSKKSSEAKKLLSQLKIDDRDFKGAKKSIKSVKGEKSEYLEKIYKILYENWIPSKYSAGYSAKVRIYINKEGTFDYEIVTLSNSPAFNKELKEYLQYLKRVSFPKPKKSQTFLVKFEAKE
jgi:hypothetical protein